MAKNISDEIEKLEARLTDLRKQKVEALEEKLKAARKVVFDLETEIAALTGKKAVAPGKRKRTSPTEMRERIFGLLGRGLRPTQKEISDKTGLNYVSVANFLKAHRKEIGYAGKRKQKRYFLK